MPKSKIIQELVNDEVSISIVLRRLYVLAFDLECNNLLVWADKELTGYKKDDNLPNYRIFKCANLVYSGINGGFQVKNLPLPLDFLDLDTIDEISVNHIMDSVSEIESKIKTDKELVIDRSYLAGEVEKNTYQKLYERGVQCTNIKQTVSSFYFAEILATIKQIALKVLLELDKKFGNLDDLDVGIERMKKKEKQELLEKIQIVFNDSIVTAKKVAVKNSNIGSDNSIQKETEIKSLVNWNKEKKANWIKKFFRRKT